MARSGQPYGDATYATFDLIINKDMSWSTTFQTIRTSEGYGNQFWAGIVDEFKINSITLF